jgi:hypothetical protein
MTSYFSSPEQIFEKERRTPKDRDVVRMCPTFELICEENTTRWTWEVDYEISTHETAKKRSVSL